MEPLHLDQARLRAPEFAVLDVRDEQAFASGHLPGSGHIPEEELVARRAELPPRDAPLLVVAGDPARAAESAAAIEGLGYARVFYLDAPLAVLPSGLADRGPAARLWRPARFLEEVLPQITGAPVPASEFQAQADTREQDRLREGAAACPQPRKALDVASGSGRDAVFLALHGFEVEARDHDAEALERARALARRCGVTLETRLFDLESPELPPPQDFFDVVICFRFLHRPLFPWMERALAPGGWLVYETFRVGQERHGRPRRAHFLLAGGELAAAFPGLTTIRYEELEPESGPVVARLLARKPDRA